MSTFTEVLQKTRGKQEYSEPVYPDAIRVLFVFHSPSFLFLAAVLDSIKYSSFNLTYCLHLLAAE